MYGKNLCNYTRVYIPDSNDPNIMLGQPAGTPVSSATHSLEPPKNDYYCQYVCYRNFNNPALRMFYFGYDFAYPNLSISNRTQNALVFNCILKGKGVFNGVPVKAGSCFFSRPNQLHSMCADKNDPWISIWFSIEGSIAKQTCDFFDKISKNQILPINNPHSLQSLTDFYLYKMGVVNFTDDFVLSVFHQLLTFLRGDDTAGTKSNVIASHLPSTIYQSLLYIEDNIQTVTVTELANRAHLEVKYFTKIFTENMGISPQKHILTMKLNTAANQLATTDTPIERISEMLGYRHRNGLSTAFRNAYGMSLTEYRKKHKQ